MFLRQYFFGSYLFVLLACRQSPYTTHITHMTIHIKFCVLFVECFYHHRLSSWTTLIWIVSSTRWYSKNRGNCWIDPIFSSMLIYCIQKPLKRNNFSLSSHQYMFCANDRRDSFHSWFRRIPRVYIMTSYQLFHMHTHLAAKVATPMKLYLVSLC